MRRGIIALVCVLLIIGISCNVNASAQLVADDWLRVDTKATAVSSVVERLDAGAIPQSPRGNDSLVTYMAKYGGDALESAVRYGDDAVGAMKNGIEPAQINKLADAGIKPTDFRKYKITDKEAAEAAIGAISKGSVKTWKEFFAADAEKYFSAKEASSSYIKLLDGKSPWPEGYEPQVTELSEGDIVNMVLDAAQEFPGRFATRDMIESVACARNKLAIQSGWKADCSRVVTYRVKANVRVRTGPVGPQIDLGVDRYLPGGGTQIELILPQGVYSNSYLEYVSERTIH